MAATGLTISPASLGAFKAELARTAVKMEKVCEAAIYLEAESIMSDSRPLVPWLTGVLKGSGYVNRPEGSGMGASVTFGYGGAASAYAWIQHEGTGFNHPRGGQAKYLLTAVEQHAANLDARLAAHVRRFV